LWNVYSVVFQAFHNMLHSANLLEWLGIMLDLTV
jgi:hypothetical protein